MRKFRTTWRRMFTVVGVTFLVIAVIALCFGWRILWMPGRSWNKSLPALTQGQKNIQERLANDVDKLCDIGDRNEFHIKELSAAADLIEAELTQAGYDVQREQFIAGKKTFYNVVAEMKGGASAEEMIVIGAHYDTNAGTVGANDNASGVAGMLEIARAMSNRKSNRTLRFVAFTNEEPPHFQYETMGSRVHARNSRARGDNIVGMLSLETIGYYSDEEGSQELPYPLGAFYPKTGNYITFVGNMKSGSFIRHCVKSFRQNAQFPSEGSALPEFIPAAGLSDQWSFWQEGYPGLMVTDTAFFRYKYYHTKQDTPDKLRFDRMARVVEGLTRVVEELADGK